MTIRILVTGSREWDDWPTLGAALDGPFNEYFGKQLVIVHGACPTGADKMAEDWVRSMRHQKFLNVTSEPHPADWSLGKRAGPIRNQQMVDLGADLCLAFPTEKSVGTWDCIKRANRAGIPVRIVPARGAKK